MLNILEDFTGEKERMEESQKAIVNILEDFALEKERLEDVQHAVINILEDFTGEKDRLEETQRAVLNILQDSSDEKAKLEEIQKAMLNLLDDFDVERSRTEQANRELRVALESIRTAKEAADAANRELAAFSYSVSHDLRAPLRALDGFSQALMEDYYDTLDDQGHDYLNRIRAASQRMALLIDDLLKLSRLTRGELNVAPVDLSALARGIAAELQRTQPERKVEFRIMKGVKATGDQNLLKAVLENLLGNAWKFTGQDGAGDDRVRRVQCRRNSRILRPRQWRGVRHEVCRQTLRCIPAAAFGQGFFRVRDRPFHRSAHRPSTRRQGLGGRKARQRRNVLFHAQHRSIKGWG